MPQLDLYNFYIIVIISIIGIVVFFINFHKYWLYSWKLLTLITFNIKNLSKIFNSVISKMFLLFVYSFFFFENLISVFCAKRNTILKFQEKVLYNFGLNIESNTLKFFN